MTSYIKSIKTLPTPPAAPPIKGKKKTLRTWMNPSLAFITFHQEILISICFQFLTFSTLIHEYSEYRARRFGCDQFKTATPCLPIQLSFACFLCEPQKTIGPTPSHLSFLPLLSKKSCRMSLRRATPPSAAKSTKGAATAQKEDIATFVVPDLTVKDLLSVIP